MNKDKFVVFIAAFITLLFGPGTGHLILRQWKKAIFFIVLSVALFIILGINFVSRLDPETIKAILNLSSYEKIEQIRNFYSVFQENNSKAMLFFDVCFAALWAYSIVDIFVSTQKNAQEEKGQEK